MNTIRTFIASALMALTCTSASADDYKYLTVDQNSGEVSFEVSNISKITFDATNMVLHLADGKTQQLPLAAPSQRFSSATACCVPPLLLARTSRSTT